MNDQDAARDSSREPENPEDEGKTSPKKLRRQKNI
jgi:hypothetical protein